jgi:hypothetical protein
MGPYPCLGPGCNPASTSCKLRVGAGQDQGLGLEYNWIRKLLQRALCIENPTPRLLITIHSYKLASHKG